MRWWSIRGEVPEVRPEELARRLADGEVQLLDVRTEAEWKRGRIEGAVSLPIHRLPAEADSLDFDKDKPVVAICLTAHRSIPAVRFLRRRGYADVVQLRGGMRAWKRAGLRRVKGEAP